MLCSGPPNRASFVTDNENKLIPLFGTWRWYSPQLLRWLNRDPILYAGGDNVYVYVASNPVASVDPTGLTPAAPAIGIACLRSPKACAAAIGATGAVISGAGEAIGTAVGNAYSDATDFINSCLEDSDEDLKKQCKEGLESDFEKCDQRFPNNPKMWHKCNSIAQERYSACSRGLPPTNWPPLPGDKWPFLH